MRRIGFQFKATMLILSAFIATVSYGQLPDAFLRGGDVSEIPQVEDAGGKYLYHGTTTDPFLLMHQANWNFVRFRVWNHPKDSYCDKEHTLALAIRAKAQGLKISLDFHYSDWWADPGKQTKPQAWKQLSFDKLLNAVHDYTKDVVGAMVQQGTPPCMVQIGNEIVGGMLWPDGKLDGNSPEPWHRLAQLIEAGIQGVHDAQGPNHIQTMIHLDRGGDNKTAVWWFDHIKKEGVKFDLIGLSYYPYWHGSLEGMQANLADLSRRYKKDIYIVETGYPWVLDARTRSSVHVQGVDRALLNGYPATAEGQAAFLKRTIDIVLKTPGGRGKGILYWAPLWISPGKQSTPYDNVALFDYSGNALPSLDVIGGAK